MKYIYILLIVLVSISTSCSSGSGGGDDDAPPPVVIDPPAAANLVFPQNAEVCAEAKNLTGNTGDSDRTYTIAFKWTGDASSSNSVKYTLNLINDDDSTTRSFDTTVNTSDVSLDVDGIIPQGNYSWEVIASKTGTTETTSSNKQTFTAAGVAAVSFSPNAATPVNPSRNEVLPNTTTSVTLEWLGSDENDDIAEYDVYFGTTNPPTDVITVSSDVNSRNVTTTANTIYYWRVITRDEVGNQSSSAVFQFTVAP
ncbi:fibronectin type III domain-containing protein [Seonamhaeicola algicola]|uniref:Fibronectin type III domain-containing protein n=1 Tax=Seonamhaeicola algicola TaxID=1719036 RepID=A0A5C7AT81_9FLAO|nr:fibronectin type III domain-containing protein [Seonamhaeicola algicola]TXE11920.1 fibronectin type III domain-containing protein [Seonamhaeicola algicola]